MMNWMLGTGVAVSLLIVLVLLVRRPFARMFGAKAVYALWVLPFLRLVMPEVTLPRFLPRIFQSSSLETALPNEIVLTPDMIALIRQAEPSLMGQVEPYLMPGLFLIWAVGAVTFFLYHWTAQASLMERLTLKSEPASKLEREIISATRCAKLKHIPTVRISDEKSGPLVAGLFFPVVILPHNFMTAFSPKQRHYALMHEFMHIKRGDMWVALAWLIFRAVNWPNPLVHYAAKYFRSDQEAACDASVLSALEDGERGNADVVTGYAETLVHAAKTTITSQTENGRASPKPSALALTIHHPLKERLMILDAHKKISNWRSRTAAAVMIIGAATLSAPLIQADAHPEKKVTEEELAGKYDSHQGKSVIKRTYEKDGETVSEHYEVLVDGNKVEAFKIDSAGRKTSIDPNQIEGIDSYSVSRDKFGKNRHLLKLGKGDNSFFFAPEKDHNDSVEIFSDEITVFNAPKPPNPPKFTQHSENVYVLESGDIKGLQQLQILEALKSLEELKGLDGLNKGLEALEAELEKIEGFITFTLPSDGGEMHRIESKLAAARSLLEDTEFDASDSREMAQAKRELEKARKALVAAEHALKDAG